MTKLKAEELGRQILHSYQEGFRSPFDYTQIGSGAYYASPVETGTLRKSIKTVMTFERKEPAPKLCQYCGRVIERYHCPGCGGDTL